MFEQGGRCSIWGPPTQQARFLRGEENRDCVVSNMEEVVRPLSSEEDVDAWAAFCASCFADKRPTPPSQAFFRAHYDLDPQRGAGARSSMLVAAAGAEAGADILSSVCVYRRELCVGGAVVVVGGVPSASACSVGALLPLLVCLPRPRKSHDNSARFRPQNQNRHIFQEYVFWPKISDATGESWTLWRLLEANLCNVGEF